MKKLLFPLIVLMIFWASFRNVMAQTINPTDTITAEYIIATRKLSIPLGRYHLSFAPLGYFSTMSPGDFKIPSLGIDCSKGPGIFLNMRNSTSPSTDIVFDLHKWGSMSENNSIKAEVDVWAFGVGGRGVMNELSSSNMYPYIQGNVYYVIEKVKASVLGQSDDADEEGFGFGANVGVELKVSPWVSIPIEVYYLYSEPADDVSGYGFYAGLTYNWGTIE